MDPARVELLMVHRSVNHALKNLVAELRCAISRPRKVNITDLVAFRQNSRTVRRTEVVTPIRRCLTLHVNHLRFRDSFTRLLCACTCRVHDAAHVGDAFGATQLSPFVASFNVRRGHDSQLISFFVDDAHLAGDDPLFTRMRKSTGLAITRTS